MKTTPARILLTLEAVPNFAHPDDPEGKPWPVDQRLKAALKSLGRRFGFRCIQITEVTPSSPSSPED